ncbi:hypothetical protein SAMN02745784_02185 [Tissierella praeacuta DSM 18095]|uniref:Uncharacterized protein n=1 Tax=Tissierella praeacuta DSM 18095 TaxID=1123404 RepID=A0A1M4XAP9_9FIRM|nr:hypothetical protein [Tissierella praeacuta]SHE90481.1 hypothetical protein SAMN02745784_02185 [Tissierella praeacuta DSM 18095]SUP02577.1 Uncharacterised protein [Tissierella praeacuta]
MVKRLDTILNYIIGSLIGVSIGYSIYKYFDYINHPDLYEVKSAPWYTSIQIQGFVIFIIIAIAIFLKIAIKKKMRND